MEFGILRGTWRILKDFLSGSLSRAASLHRSDANESYRRAGLKALVRLFEGGGEAK